jgi:hypothetical protein
MAVESRGPRTNFPREDKVEVLETLVRRPLAPSMKVERTNFRSPPIELLESLVHSTDGRSVKCPLLTHQL